MRSITDLRNVLDTLKTFSIQNSSASLPPVLIYHDTTPLLGAGKSTGTIELDHGVARSLGVDPSFWISVALAYLEFLEERDVRIRSHHFWWNA